MVVALGQVLAAHESHLDRFTWRQDGTRNNAGIYLRFLATNGYDLSEVETYAISKKTA